MPQEVLGRPKKERTSRRIEPSQLFDQIILHELIYRVVALDAADFLDLQLRDRLLIGNDRQRLHHHIGQCQLLRLLRHPDQIRIQLLLRAELVGPVELHDLDATVLFPIAIHHMSDEFSRRLRILLDRLCDLLQLYRISHSK